MVVSTTHTHTSRGGQLQTNTHTQVVVVNTNTQTHKSYQPVTSAANMGGWPYRSVRAHQDGEVGEMITAAGGDTCVGLQHPAALLRPPG